MSGRDGHALTRAADEWGTIVPCAGNSPIEITDPAFGWFVESGAVDLFLVERRDGVDQAAPQHVLRASEGRLLPGVAQQHDETSLTLVAKGLPGTVLRRLPIARLHEIRSAELVEQIEAWLMDISSMLVRDLTHRPRMDALLEPGEDATVRNGFLSARRGVVWITAFPWDGCMFTSLSEVRGTVRSDHSATGTLPLTGDTWLELPHETRISTASSAELARQGRLLPALNAFHEQAFSLERLNRQLAIVDRANLARERVVTRRLDEASARRRLLDLCEPGRSRAEDGDASALKNALSIIGRHAGLAFKHPPGQPGEPASRLSRILSASGIRGRKVALARRDRWWVGDSGPLLGFRAEDGRPVALIPGGFGNYREVDPLNGGKRRITAANSESLLREAWVFLGPLDPEATEPRDLLGIANEGLKGDLARFVLIGLLGGLLTLLPAVALGFVVDRVIPLADYGVLYGISLALVAFGFFRALLHVLLSVTHMRIEGRAASRLEAALWDRMLRLPSHILRTFTASDLAMRGMVASGMRDAAQSVVGNGVLSILFLAPALLLIAAHNATLGWLTAAFALLALIATVVIGRRQLAPNRRKLKAAHAMSGQLFQLISGIAQLRGDGAEGAGYAAWARRYRVQKRAEAAIAGADRHLRALGAALPLLAAAVLILAVAVSGTTSITVGEFIVIYALFLLYLTAVIRLGESFRALAAVAPAVDQLRPLLAPKPEKTLRGEPVGVLTGDIRFDRVSFRYGPDLPLIFDDLSFHIRAGDFVAITGESGAGKSTLLRLMLGIERPTSGSVYFDGRDLQRLNLSDVRRQIGVVPQMVRLHPFSLWDNVVGSHEGATAEDAWEALRIARIDHEVRKMPMGLLTQVGSSFDVLSGGEAQRIRIAHALIGNPRILLFDEATNWLDNRTQDRVTKNLGGLTSTRVVIAHRLSTLREADRIYVLHGGRIVQAGTYTELASVQGAFKDLIRRQVA